MRDDERVQPLATVLLFFVLISLGPLLYLHHAWLDEVEAQSRVQTHLGQVRENLAEAHLWFEELLTGDPNIKPAQVWELFASAEAALSKFKAEQYELDKQLLSFVPSSGTPVPVLIERLSERSATLESLARTRHQSLSDSSAGTAIDEQFDVIFTETLAASFEIERAVREFSTMRMSGRREIHWVTLVLWGTGAAGTGLGLFFVNRRRRIEEEKVILEAQFQQAQKLESLGVLAGGIAHDFNNLLMEISGNTSLLLLDSELKDDVRSAIKEIDSGAQKAAGLTSQMLAYAGKGKFIETVIDFDELVREMDSLLSLSVSKRVSVEYSLSGKINPVQCNPTQLQQVIMNLLINASEASDEAAGEAEGSIYVRSRRETIDSKYEFPSSVKSLSPPSPGRYLMMDIQDTGSGMSEEVMNRCFEPFFSTKFTGRGLGLSAVLGIVESHQGAIQLTSQEGVGTTFTIFLPISELEVTAIPLATKTDNLRGQGRILVIDDDPTVVRIVERMLTRVGYEVESCNSGEEGLRAIAQNPERYDLAMVDMEMPGINGEAVATEIRAKEYSIRLILSSGYTKDVLSSENADILFDAFIQKPYRVQELFETVTQVLESH
jgi:signal transduction histidine kinase/ActR/RegA family two-component response regulator